MTTLTDATKLVETVISLMKDGRGTIREVMALVSALREGRNIFADVPWSKLAKLGPVTAATPWQGLAIAFAAGAATGAGAGLLFAPMSGEELRSKIAERIGLPDFSDVLEGVELDWMEKGWLSRAEPNAVRSQDELMARQELAVLDHMPVVVPGVAASEAIESLRV